MGTIRGTVAIDIETCKGCELCVEACPQESLKLSREINKQGYHYAVLVADNCTGCVNCALVCPDAVITVYRAAKDGKKERIAEIRNVKRDIRISIDELPEGKVRV
jgi:2-oxoglutarate ferredoxin oxidoreductase subunit delta